VYINRQKTDSPGVIDRVRKIHRRGTELTQRGRRELNDEIGTMNDEGTMK
jgi:hypothetical protein